MPIIQEPLKAPSPTTLTQPDKEYVQYRLSNLLTRFVIGAIAFVLPIICIFWEWLVLKEGGLRVRGSLSAYYHTSARDIFVAALCVVGFFLVTYMSGQIRTLDFWLSLVAGLTVLGVAFFPTMRPGLSPDAPECGPRITPTPEGCSSIQQQFGERLVAQIHFVCAAVFIISLALMCFLVFAKSEKERSERPEMATKPWMATVMCVCGWVIIAAIGWVIAGRFLELTIWQITPLFAAEVTAVWAFSAAWLLKARDLRHAIRPLRRGGGSD
jgi:hypothetical protein